MDEESLNMIAEHYGLKQANNSDNKVTWKEGLREEEKLFVMGIASHDVTELFLE